jgi:peptidoglycan/LPS O-acetylase OafA/YrhL
LGISSELVGELAPLWPILVVGFVLFVVWYAGKAAAARSGRHLGILGVGLVLVVLAIASWWLGCGDLALVFGVFGLVLVAAGATGSTSR